MLDGITAQLLACMLALAVFAAPSFADPPPIVDTHAHIVNAGGRRGSPDFRASLNAAVRVMDRAGIQRAIIMPPPMAADRPTYDIESYRFAGEAYNGRILPGGGGGTLNGMIHSIAPNAVSDDQNNAFRARALEIAAAGAVVYGEIALHHLSLTAMGAQHPYEVTAPDHPLMLLLAAVAAEKNIPIDVHIDLVPDDMSLPDRPIFNTGNPRALKANLAAFERLLAHNRAARIVWAHAGTDPLGTRTPELQRALLARHPNLFMSLRLNAAGPPPFIALDGEKKLKPAWLALVKEFPDRFVVGTDFFHAPAGLPQRGAGVEALENYRSALAQMPAELADAIARKNAAKIYRIGE